MPYLPLSPSNTSGFFTGRNGDDLHQHHQLRRRRWTIFGLLAGIPLLFWFGFHSSGKNHVVPTAALKLAWQRMGTQDVELAPCESTFLYTFLGEKGFGSELGIFVRSALWAKHHNYTLLVANEDWVYGRFEDYFELPPLDCKPDPEAYDHRSPTVTLVGKPGWQNATRLSMRRGYYAPIDMWMMRELMDVDGIMSLPEVDLTRPLPIGETVLPVMRDIYLELHDVFRSLWRPVPALDALVQHVRGQYHLIDGVYGSGPTRGHVIGLHYRGGDKLAHECTIEMHCGNTTTYFQSALQVLHKLPPASCPDCKPVLALMTIEPDALELFQSDPLSAAFDIQPLPPPTSGLKGHRQATFNSWPIEERIDDTRVLLRDLTLLSLHADAFIVSGSSNVGIMAMLLGGPSKVIQSIDWRFMATTRPLGWYAERGLDYRTEGQ